MIVDTRRAITDPSRPAYVPGHRTVVHIPFTGDETIFSLKPSSYDLNPPLADVADSELRLVIEYPSDTPADIKGETNGLVNHVTKYLGFAEKDIQQYNHGLESKARAAIQSRRQRVERHRAHIQATGFPSVPRTVGRTFGGLVTPPCPRTGSRLVALHVLVAVCEPAS